MKVLKTLIKLNKNKLDKILRDLDRAESEKVRLEKKQQIIEEETGREIQKFSTTEYAYMLDRYMQNSRKTIKRIRAEIDQLLPIIEVLKIELRVQYSELKKFEIAFENKKKQEQEKQKKIEDKLLDEFSTNKFIFNKRSGKK
jgi:flagellar export protein FliJ